jgi:hypothetical protein
MRAALVFALALPLALVALGSGAETLEGPEAVDRVVTVSDVRAADGAVEATLHNRGSAALRDVRLLIDCVYDWPEERQPGATSPGRAWVHVVPGPIAPGGALAVRFVPPDGLPSGPGAFRTSVKVLGFTAVGD